MENEGGPRDKSIATTLERTGNVPGAMNGGFEMLQRGMSLKILGYNNSHVQFEDCAQTGKYVCRMGNNH